MWLLRLRYGVGIDPMQEPLCSREEAEYLVDALDKGKAKKPQQEFSFTVWFAVLRQKVVWGMALTTVINGLGKPMTAGPRRVLVKKNRAVAVKTIAP